jgi:hypothetical protein
MAGEIIKGTVNIKNPIAGNGNNGANNYINTIAGSNPGNQMLVANAYNHVYNEINLDNDNKILVEQGKQFKVYQVTFDPNVLAANVDNIIIDRINQWVACNGMRYDDLIITVNNSGGATHDVMVTIVRYF